MQFEELRFVCQQAAIDLTRTRGRPLPPTVILPGPDRTRLLTLPELPEADEARHAVLAQLAADHITLGGVPCWGFVAEAEVDGEDAVVVVYGARRHAPHVTGSRFDASGELEEFVASEELDPTALPFLHPLQHAVDALPAAGDVFSEADPKRGGPPGGLPVIP
ncbi:MAG: hypothetical protein EA340_01260 [Nitriliruptor sp.]|nr:MAG: hypothetical protein EA340_01260 [Nitriliruptor sp.]